MQRAPVVLAATVAGLAAALGFNARSEAPTTATAVTTTSSSGTSASPSSPSSASPSPSSSASTKTATGDAIATRYGNVQLKVTMSGGKITNVEPVQLPSDEPKSVEIGDYAVPLLRQSALSKQSANIDVVSGATYTSDGYKTALQSALDEAGFHAATTSSGASAS